MTGIRLTVRQRHRVLLSLAFLCLLGLGFAPHASAAGPGSFGPTGSLSVSRIEAAAAPLPGGRVLVAGGNGASAEIFNRSTNTFSSEGIGSMSVSRFGAAAAPLPDGRVLVVGGCCVSQQYLSSAEIFNPATNTFSSAGIGSMSVPRYEAVAAPLPDGRVLVAGGRPYDPQGAEIFDPATNSFSSAGIGSMSTPRTNAAAAPLPDGRVLVVGGFQSDNEPPYTLSSAEVFNPATRRFSSAGIGSMSTPRYGAVAAPLPDGRVLVAGGIEDYFDLYPCYLSSAEVFDPTTNGFSSEGISPMSRPRTEAAAAPLPDGVLVAGGYYAVDFLGRGCPDEFACDAKTTAEIFALGAPPAPPETCSPPAPPAASATCRGKQATIMASNGADRGFKGTPGADVIVGLDGNDELSGLAGNDLICGGNGKDTLSGQNGNDTLSGEVGNDTLESGPGKDILKGGPGKDILKGGPGMDILKGSTGNDILKGGPGKDILKGGPGKDKQAE